MATTDFQTGTVVTKEWLNDADALIYEGNWPATVVPKTDTISEETTGAGVTIDGVQCKDSTVVMGSPFSFRNWLFNGNFDIWQRGTSLGSGTGSRYFADRWNCSSIGSTCTASRQSFTIGQTDVPGDPKYFHRLVATTVAGAGNYVNMQQPIEDVRSKANRNAIVSFYAKADASKNIAVEFAQSFGTGGSPSAAVNAIKVETISLTTSWQKFTISVTIPSVSGKTLGSNNNDYFQCIFWVDAGSSFNSRTNSLGQQSITFDLARVQLEEGSVATPFEERPYQLELSLCQRYYEKSFEPDTTPAQNTGSTAGAFMFQQAVGAGAATNSPGIYYKVLKRANPNVTLYNPAAANAQVRNTDQSLDCTASSATVLGKQMFIVPHTTAGGSSEGATHAVHWTADAEL